jgi:type IV secretory pathway VirB6-like protein
MADQAAGNQAHPSEDQGAANQAVPRDWRAVIVIAVGLGVILVVVVVAFIALPGAVPMGQVNNKGQNMVAIASAAFTAVGSVVSAYFGIKAANLAREESDKSAQRHEIRTAELAAVTPEQAPEANRRAVNQIRALGL